MTGWNDVGKSKIKLTNNADETDVSALMGNDNIFAIPFFQRPYKWKPDRIKQLNSDILSLVDEENDVHFLGAIIIHGIPSKPSEAQVYEVIDGQQRLTTLYLYMCAAIKTLIDEEESSEAANLFRKYMVTSIDTRGMSNLTLHSCKEDRSQLNEVVRELLETKGFEKRLAGFEFRRLAGTGVTTGTLRNNYAAAKRFFRSQLDQGGIERVREAYTCLLQRVSVVQIDVQDPTNGPKIFDSLNSRQEPMTIGDLVRNDIFSRVALTDPDSAAEIDAHDWYPFYDRFKISGKNHFDSYFFPFGLVHDANLRKSEVYSALQKRWNGMQPKRVIEELSEYQDAFLDLVAGTNYCGHPRGVALRFRRLHEGGMPSSTYPFLMLLSQAVSRDVDGSSEGVEPREAEAVLDVIDSFLTRRAICGHEPTGLHAVFKRLWDDCQGEVTAGRVARALAGHKTVVWPTGQDVTAAIKSRPLYGAAITKYLVLQFEESLDGDRVSDVPWLEHVLPSTHNAEWSQFTREQHNDSKDLLANLLPLSSSMNSALGNRAYSLKRSKYMDDSVFKSAREFAKSHQEWTPELLAERGVDLALWACQRWPHEAPPRNT